MSTMTYAVLNEKGGVGKSTTAIELATFYAGMEGTTVFLVDLDPLCASTHACGLSGHEQANISHVLTGACTLYGASKLKRINKGWRDVRIVPGSLDLEDTVADLVAADAGVLALRRAVDVLSSNPAHSTHEQIVVLDCPAGLNVLTLNALIAADVVIIPTTPHAWSIAGATAIVAKIAEVNEVRTAYGYPVVRGVHTIVTMFDTRTSADHEGLASVQADPALNYAGRIPRRTGRDAARLITDAYAWPFGLVHERTFLR